MHPHLQDKRRRGNVKNKRMRAYNFGWKLTVNREPLDVLLGAEQSGTYHPRLDVAVWPMWYHMTWGFSMNASYRFLLSSLRSIHMLSSPAELKSNSFFPILYLRIGFFFFRGGEWSQFSPFHFLDEFHFSILLIFLNFKLIHKYISYSFQFYVAS